MTALRIAIAGVCSIAVFAGATRAQTGQVTEAAANLGLILREDGVLLRKGRPYRAIGVNYFDAFVRHLHNPKDESFDAGFKALAERGIPFARICGCGFWPSEQKLYQQNSKEFFVRFDEVVRSAERHSIGLVPSLFWNLSTVPDLVCEPVNQWGNPQSKTHQYMRSYVHGMVTRYSNSPAIWGWEFGNEYNLSADLPNAAEHRPQVVPQLGTPTTRSQNDELSVENVRIALAAFATEVRKYERHRVIFTGNSIPRGSAWHNWKEKSWAADTPEQFALMLREDSPNLDQSNRVQCVVDFFGPTDFVSWDPNFNKNVYAMIARLIGGPVQENREKARKASPLNYVSKDSAPILIMHGDKDNLVPLSQSEVLAAALKKSGAEVTLQVIKGNGHGGPGFSSLESRKLIEDFFAKHLGKVKP